MYAVKPPPLKKNKTLLLKENWQLVYFPIAVTSFVFLLRVSVFKIPSDP